ncbi:hypothetical protein BJ165DRAFT_1406042 [Panaeolus papilionaceus]|nr:hypothetical protein BJ165DRAFT_1406042 [Panaeolus papilionaceus]
MWVVEDMMKLEAASQDEHSEAGHSVGFKAMHGVNHFSMMDVDSLIYLCPITDTRLPGSKRRIIKMMQSLLPDTSPPRISIVATMWNTISNPQSRARVEANFEQFRDEIWKELTHIDKGTQLVRFYNNRASAVGIIGITDPNPELKPYLISELDEVAAELRKFIQQMVAFGKPPKDLKGVPNQIIYQDRLDDVIEADEGRTAIRLALSQFHDQPQPDETRKLALEALLPEYESWYINCVQDLVSFGSPPTGFELMVFPEDILNFWNRVRQRSSVKKRDRKGKWSWKK